MQERYAELRADEGELLRLLAHGADKARAASAPTLERMYEAMGFVRAVKTTAIIAARCSRSSSSPASSTTRTLRRSRSFVVSGVALGGVAWAIGIATESVGARFGPAVTGVLQSTLGNLPELFIVLFSLSAGELVVAQFSILGSLFANALLVLGLAIVGGRRRRATAA